MKDYYEPWTYNYEHLTNAGEKKHQPVARPKSAVTGETMNLEWGPNWEDDLAGAHVTGPKDPNIEKIEEEIKFNFEQAFMMYLPRLCEHCLNPSCVASCPSGAMYKRDEDGIVLVDQEACRGWRYCMTGCPYKRCTSTGKRTRPRNAPSVSRESKQGCQRYAPKPVQDASVTWACCSMTRTAYRKQLPRRMRRICIRRSAICSWIPTIRGHRASAQRRLVGRMDRSCPKLAGL